MARTLNTTDTSEAERQLRDQFDAALEPQMPRAFELLVGTPSRDGRDLVAGGPDGTSVRLDTSYTAWTLSRPKLADKEGRGVSTLCLELMRMQPGLGKARPIDLYRALSKLLSLDIDVNALVDDASKTVVAHAMLPAPARYFPVPTPEEIRALADKGSREHLVQLFCSATAVYRYEDARGQFYYYKLRLENKAQDTKTFLRVAYTAHDGLRAEGPRLRLQVGNQLPVYNLRELLARPQARVLVVEGEKTQQAAAKRFPEYVVVSADVPTAPEDTDWSPLADRDVLIVPDNDAPGMRFAQRVLGEIRAAAGALRRRSDRLTPPIRAIVPLPQYDLPDHHDLADPDPVGFEGWAEKALNEALLPDPDTIRLNEQFVFVNDLTGGEAYVVVKNVGQNDGVTRAYARLTQRELHTHYVNDLRPQLVGRATVDTPVSRIWIESPHRETVTQVICDPNPKYVARADVYNYWRGFNTQPEPGQYPTLQTLLDALSDDPGVRHFVECFLASIFQRPHRVPNCALVIRGRQGVGKSLLAQVLELMVGYQHALRSNNPELEVLGEFNELVEGQVLVILEEFTPGSQRRGNGLGKLKNLITSDTLVINGKGLHHCVVRNFAHVIITSNEDVVVTSGADSRRFIYTTMSPSLGSRELRAFADATVNARNAQHPELRAFMHHLMHEVDISDWDASKTPDTSDQQLNRAASVDEDSTLSWWTKCLEDGRVFGIPLAGRVVPAVAFDRSYQDFCFNQRILRPTGRSTFRHRLWVFMHGRAKPRVKPVRQRGDSPSLGLDENKRAELGLNSNAVEVIKVPPLQDLLQTLQYETGIILDLNPGSDHEEYVQPQEDIPF